MNDVYPKNVQLFNTLPNYVSSLIEFHNTFYITGIISTNNHGISLQLTPINACYLFRLILNIDIPWFTYKQLIYVQTKVRYMMGFGAAITKLSALYIFYRYKQSYTVLLPR